MFCPKCGKESKDGAAFCGGCGAKLPTSSGSQLVNVTPSSSVSAVAQSSTPASGSANNKNRIIAIAIVCIVVIAIVIVAFATNCFGFFGSNKAEITGQASIEETANEPGTEQPQAESQSPSEESSSAAVTTQTEQTEPEETASPLDSYSWSKLAKISREIGRAKSEEKAIKIAKSYNLCSASGTLDGTQKKSVTLSDGTKTTVQIVGFWHDIKTNGGKAGITFIFSDAITERTMNSSLTNKGGWRDSDLRAWLASDGMEMLPKDLKKCIVAVNKRTNNVGGTARNTSCISITSDKLWLFSLTELCGFVNHTNAFYDNDIHNEEGSEYLLFSNMNVEEDEENEILARYYKNDNEACYWWERSTDAGGIPDDFMVVGGRYDPGQPCIVSDSTKLNGVVPGFCI